jgi:outer membrane immunogenic protein
MSGKVLLASVCMASGLTAWAQVQSAVRYAPASIDQAFTYAPERARLAPGTAAASGCKAAARTRAVNLWKGFGLIASFSGGHASNIASGVDANKIVYLGGVPYTRALPGPRKEAAPQRHLQYFGQALFGSVHAFNGVFPSHEGVKSSTDAFALQAGGGLNMALSWRFGLRLIQVDYLRTTLPNNGSDTQNDLRLAVGVTYHLGKD